MDERVPVRITFGIRTVTEDDCEISKIAFNYGCSSESFLTLGSTFSPTCTVEMEAQVYILQSVHFVVEFYNAITEQWDNFGEYAICDMPDEIDGKVTFVGKGKMACAGEKTCSNSLLYSATGRTAKTLLDFTTLIYNNTGIEVVNDTGINPQIYFPISDSGVAGPAKSYRYIIGFLALQVGGLAIEYMGKVHIVKPFQYGVQAEVTEDDYFEFKPYDHPIHIGQVSIVCRPCALKNDVAFYSTSEESDGSSTFTSGNTDNGKSALSIELDAAYNPIEICKMAVSSLDQVYHAGSVKIYGNRYIKPSGLVNVKKGESTFQLYCMTIQLEWDGGFTTYIETQTQSDDSNSSTLPQTLSQTDIRTIVLSTKYAEFEKLYVEDLEAINVRITGKLDASEAAITYATIANLDAVSGRVGTLEAKAITTDNLNANVANIGTLTAADSIMQNISAVCLSANAIKVAVLDAGFLTADEANIKYADIGLAKVSTADVGTLFAKVGLLDRATIVDGHVTGFLDAVEVNADRITAGTLLTDRLVIRGTSKSIVYALNSVTGALQSQSVNTINGEVITDRTINADKIIAGSITAKEIDVKDLFAQDITATGTIRGVMLVGTRMASTNCDMINNIGSCFDADAGTIDINFAGKKTLILGGTIGVGTTSITEDAITLGGEQQCELKRDGLSFNNGSNRILSSATSDGKSGLIIDGKDYLRIGPLWMDSDVSITTNLSVSDTLTANGGLTVNNSPVTINSGLVANVGCTINVGGTNVLSVGSYGDQGAILIGTKEVIIDNYNVMLSKADNYGYYGLVSPSGDATNWIRTSVNGLIPYSVGNSSSIGTSSWRFTSGYFVNLNTSGTLTVSGDTSIAGYLHQNGSIIMQNTGDYMPWIRLAPTIASRADGGIGCHATSGGEYTILGCGHDGSINYSFFGHPSMRGVLRGSTIRLASTSGTQVTSDLTKKKDYENIGMDQRYVEFFNRLNPLHYRYIDGNSGRIHLGFGVQHVEQALYDSGLSTKEFAGVIIDYEEEEGEPLDVPYKALIYDEFIALNTFMIQDTRSTVENLRSKVEQLQNKIEKLERMVA